MSIDMNALHLPDDSFWSGPPRGPHPVIRKHRNNYFGVVVDAPHEVNLATRSTLPIYTYYMGEFRQLCTRDFDAQGIVTVMDADRNILRVCAANNMDAGEDPDPDFVPPPPEPTPAGYGAEANRLELRDRLDFPWKPTKFILQAILLDLASPRVECNLVAPASQFDDEEVAKFLAAERAAVNPPAPFPEPGKGLYPNYRRGPDSPDIPSEPGVALKVERVAAVDGTKPLPLHGAWRLPVMPEDVVKPDNAEYNRANGLLQSGGTPYAAAVTIYLLVLGAADGRPKTYRLTLPVASIGEGEASGQFAINLLDLPEFPVADHTLFLYAFVREFATGPVLLGLVDRRPDEAPRPTLDESDEA